ncbi:hypothetical protein BDV24DRAFT_168496 [Aspergillus arachidicola]|uniref:Uncharacterized protein n=1 Tax=Aspergillus arachidicola TaxID=656916 RepID=A0A5N6XSL3_9EURO|nr:hypothetical protein BDV24DRAFT_168496 [Aspergillus arachidicola]
MSLVISAQEYHASRINPGPIPSTFDEFMERRLVYSGFHVFAKFIALAMDFRAQDESMSTIEDIIRPLERAMALCNDYFSWPKDKEHFQQGKGSNVVVFLQQVKGMSEEEALESIKRQVISLEEKHNSAFDHLMKANTISSEVQSYLIAFRLAAGVTESARTRTNVFSQMTAVILTTELIAPPIGAALMTISPWIPFLASYVIAAISVIWAVFLFPAIRNRTEPASTTAHEEQPDRTWYVLERITQFYSQLAQNRIVALVVASFFVALLGISYTEVRNLDDLQVPGQRPMLYVVFLPQASYILPLRAATNLVSLFILLPTGTHFLDHNQGLDIILRHKILTQANAPLMLLGCLLIFLASNLILLSIGIVIFGLGASLSVTARTLATCLIATASLRTTYALMSVMSSIGSLVSGPSLVGVYY